MASQVSKQQAFANIQAKGEAPAEYHLSTAPIAPELPEHAGALSSVMQSIARNYLGARARAGGAILDAARFLAEARQVAKYGEWGIFLEATGTTEDTASRMIAIATRASADQQYARAINDGRLAFTAAFEILNAPAETQQRALESSEPTPISQIRQAKQESKLRNVAEFQAPPALHPDYEHQVAVERILKDATTPEEVQEAYTHARQTRDLMMYNKLMGMVDRAMDATVKAEQPAAKAASAAPDTTAEAIEQRTPQDLIDAGLDMRRHGSWFIAIGTRGLMRGWEIRTAAPFDQIVAQARAEIARRTPPAPPAASPESIHPPAVPPRPRRPISADVSATIAYINQLEAYASALEGYIMALQKQMK
jgi:hypothetical protein